MSDTVNGTAVYLSPGMKVKLKVPVNGPNNQGFFTRTEELPAGFWKDQNKAGEIIRGFVVENTDVGELRPTDEAEAAVTYCHKQPYPNAIWFFARTGERGLVRVISVPIHDHSTIVHGGPAYGTYFDDDLER